ncbi:abasic site processing protein HMCES isoform X2 [Athalia rosae]|uniref:abasic site processing protein HMCES isoform X2 n=1 Tax=Athalia rosae TaxID=37344 RepID=UPI002034A3C2|nr:abasic site processing protein HMCES isoform X2 [Athalia rosae]
MYIVRTCIHLPAARRYATLDSNEICGSCGYKEQKFKQLSWQSSDIGDGMTGYSPSYNLAPRDVTPCIVSGSHFKSKEKQVLHPMIWGMIPRWHKGDYRKHSMTTHNARSEGLLESKLYSQPLTQGQRCVILCEGYYEWKTKNKNKSDPKQPYFIYSKQNDGVEIQDRDTWKNEWSMENGWNGIKLLKLAGIFDSWLTVEKKKIYSCSMITTDANNVLSWLHDRTPVFLETEKEISDWLDDKSIPATKAIKNLHGPTEDTLKWHPVDPAVNNSRFKSDTCYHPIKLEEKKKLAPSGLMASWLKTGRMSTDKKKSSDDDCSEPDVKRSKLM